MLEIQTIKDEYMNVVRKTLSPIIRRQLFKVNTWQEARVEFKDLSTAEQLEIMDEVQKAMDAEVKRQFDKIQKVKAVISKT